MNEEEINKNLNKNLSNLFSSCMDILRNQEHITGEKALKNFSYLLVLRLLEPKLEDLKLEDCDYNMDECEKKKLLEYTRFSKIVSCKEEDIPSILEYTWNNILSQHPKTKSIFQPGKGFEFKKQTTFKKLIEKLFDFNFDNIESDIQGHAYEDLLRDVMKGQVLGQYFTQPLIKDIMVELVNPRAFPDGTIETIFDPAMGTGGFLITSLRYILDIQKNLDWDFIVQKGLGGREAEIDTFQMAKANMLITSGRLFNNLQHGDSIRDPITEKFDIVLTNPPFGIKGLLYRDITSELRDKYMPIESKNAVSLFLQLIIYILKIEGRCAMIMPDGHELFNKTSPSIIALREYLFKTCDVKEILHLPSGVFTNTSIKTCILYFHKKREGDQVIRFEESKKRTYKFCKTIQTKSVKFYNYDPYEKTKTFLLTVEKDELEKKLFSLDYTDYINKNIQTAKQEYKRIGDICVFLEKSKRPAKYGKESGTFPFFTSSKTVKFCDVPDYKEECLIIGDGGVPNVKYSDCFSCSDHNFILKSKNSEVILTKFLYYYLVNNLNIFENGFKGVTIKNLSKDYLCNIQIPVFDITTQKEVIQKCEEYDETICNLELQKERTKEMKKKLIDSLVI